MSLDAWQVVLRLVRNLHTSREYVVYKFCLSVLLVMYVPKSCAKCDFVAVLSSHPAKDELLKVVYFLLWSILEKTMDIRFLKRSTFDPKRRYYKRIRNPIGLSDLLTSPRCSSCLDQMCYLSEEPYFSFSGSYVMKSGDTRCPHHLGSNRLCTTQFTISITTELLHRIRKSSAVMMVGSSNLHSNNGPTFAGLI